MCTLPRNSCLQVGTGVEGNMGSRFSTNSLQQFAGKYCRVSVGCLRLILLLVWVKVFNILVLEGFGPHKIKQSISTNLSVACKVSKEYFLDTFISS